MTGGQPSGVSVDEHLRWCPHCSELFRNEAALGRRLAAATHGTPVQLDQQLEVMESLIVRERGLRAFLRSRSTRVRWAASLALPGILLLREFARHRELAEGFSWPRAFSFAFLLGLLALVLYSALRLLPLRAARFRSALAWVAWCLPCALLLAPEVQASADEFSGQWVARSGSCFAYGSALATPSFALLWAFDRGLRVPFYVWALGAGAVALLANLVLLLHCASRSPAHLMAGHATIGLAWFASVSLAWWVRRLA